MLRFRPLVPLLFAAWALAACRDAPRGEPAATPAPAAAVADAAPSADAHRVTIKGTEHAARPALLFTLVAPVAPGADGILQIRAIEVRRADNSDLLQSLDGLDTQTPSSADLPGLEQIDLDFDGIPDLRVVEFLPAGPNVPYRNWRYDPGSGRFVAMPDLDKITSPVFDTVRREIRSDWRDSATRQGTDSFAWREGRLEPLRRVTSEVVGPGQPTQSSYTWSAGDWVLQNKR